MLTLLERGAGNAVGVKVSGKLTRGDYQQMATELERRIQKHGNIRLLLEADDFHGWELGAAWEDLKFGIRHAGAVERCAVVGEKKWQERLTKLVRPFLSVRYFDRTEEENAWQWLEGNRPEAPGPAATSAAKKAIA